ncbi:MAG: hypothetical protein GY757_01025 [bacterium]|nr:hypothetical protein [bacterium]
MSVTASAKIAKTAGTKVAARAGGRFLGPIVAIGVIIWEFWDHYSNKKEALPRLRKNIADYFKEVKHLLLYDGKYGIMTIIYKMEMDMSKKSNVIR